MLMPFTVSDILSDDRASDFYQGMFHIFCPCPVVGIPSLDWIGLSHHIKHPCPYLPHIYSF